MTLKAASASLAFGACCVRQMATVLMVCVIVSLQLAPPDVAITKDVSANSATIGTVLTYTIRL
jgi:hypothetical protein